MNEVQGKLWIKLVLTSYIQTYTHTINTRYSPLHFIQQRVLQNQIDFSFFQFLVCLWIPYNGIRDRPKTEPKKSEFDFQKHVDERSAREIAGEVRADLTHSNIQT